MIFSFYAKESDTVTGSGNDVLWLTAIIFRAGKGGSNHVWQANSPL